MTPAQLDQSTTALYFDNACPWISAVLDFHHAVRGVIGRCQQFPLGTAPDAVNTRNEWPVPVILTLGPSTNGNCKCTTTSET
jgi:hypothetical protein